MSSFELSWATLPSLPLERVCAFVPLVDLVQLSRVNRHYHDVLEGALGMREIGEAMFECPENPLMGAARTDTPRAAHYFLKLRDPDSPPPLKELLVTIKCNSLETMECMDPYLPHNSRLAIWATLQTEYWNNDDARRWLKDRGSYCETLVGIDAGAGPPPFDDGGEWSSFSRKLRMCQMLENSEKS